MRNFKLCLEVSLPDNEEGNNITVMQHVQERLTRHGDDHINYYVQTCREVDATVNSFPTPPLS